MGVDSPGRDQFRKVLIMNDRDQNSCQEERNLEDIKAGQKAKGNFKNLQIMFSENGVISHPRNKNGIFYKGTIREQDKALRN